MKTLYSVNDEDFNLSSVGEVLDQLNSDGQTLLGAVYWEADFVKCKPSEYLNASIILENADEAAWDDLGEGYDLQFSTVSPAAREELQKFLNKWGKKNTNIQRWRRIKGSSRKLVLVESDL